MRSRRIADFAGALMADFAQPATAISSTMRHLDLDTRLTDKGEDETGLTTDDTRRSWSDCCRPCPNRACRSVPQAKTWQRRRPGRQQGSARGRRTGGRQTPFEVRSKASRQSQACPASQAQSAPWWHPGPSVPMSDSMHQLDHTQTRTDPVRQSLSQTKSSDLPAETS
jgi:hypothetical protein